MKNTIICGPGRTGSHVILNYYCKHGYHDIRLDTLNQFENDESRYNFENKHPLILHYHGVTWMPDCPEHWTIIYSYRRDVFDCYCSHIIAQRTKQWAFYSHQLRAPRIKINLEHAFYCCRTYIEHKKNVKKLMLNARPWKKIIEIAYEDFMPDIKNLFKLIPLDEEYNESSKDMSEPSPYRFEECIHGYQQVKKQFLREFGPYQFPTDLSQHIRR